MDGLSPSQSWLQKVSKGKSSQPSREAYSHVKRVFTGEEETVLLQHIQTNFRFNASAVHRRTLDETGVNSFAEGLQDLLKVRDFTCPSAFIKDFRRRRALESPRPRLQRKSTVSLQQVEDFVQRVQLLFDACPLEPIPITDETSCKTISSGR
jgi:transposase